MDIIIIVAVVVLFVGVFGHRQALGKISNDLEELKNEIDELKEKLGIETDELDSE